MSTQLSRNFEAQEHWWLCAQCAVTFTIHFDRETGIHVVPKTKFENGECVHVASLYRAGLRESDPNRCGRFVSASTRVRLLEVAEGAHHCEKPASLALAEQ